jgi:hypothetical protein
VVIVLRRKPTRVYHILCWNTETDEIERGSWARTRIYELGCDVSFDGNWMSYLVLGGSAGNWMGVCRPPFLRSFIHLDCSTWNEFGGGLFTYGNRLEIKSSDGIRNIGYQRKEFTLPLEIVDMTKVRHSSMDALRMRLARDGYIGADSQATQWTIRPTDRHPTLQIRVVPGAKLGEDALSFRLLEMPDFLDELVTWAAYDSLGQLVFARQGVLYRFSLAGLLNGTPDAEIDLEALTPPLGKGIVPDGDLKTPEISVSMGPIENLRVSTLILPSQRAAWAESVRCFAEPSLNDEVAEQNLAPGEVFISPGFSLMAKTLVHVSEPGPDLGIDLLRQACKDVFDCVSAVSGDHVALQVIGLASGWPLETAAIETIAAASDYVAGASGRSVHIVVENYRDRETLEKLLDIDPSWAWG